jgi:hypothetical protein
MYTINKELKSITNMNIGVEMSGSGDSLNEKYNHEDGSTEQTQTTVSLEDELVYICQTFPDQREDTDLVDERRVWRIKRSKNVASPVANEDQDLFMHRNVADSLQVAGSKELPASNVAMDVPPRVETVKPSKRDDVFTAKKIENATNTHGKAVEQTKKDEEHTGIANHNCTHSNNDVAEILVRSEQNIHSDSVSSLLCFMNEKIQLGNSNIQMEGEDSLTREDDTKRKEIFRWLGGLSH